MTVASHVILLVEEPSMEAFLNALLPRLSPEGRTYEVHPFQGKNDLMGKLEARLSAYAQWLPEDWRIFVIVDRDDDDCHQLKEKMEDISRRSGLLSRKNISNNKKSVWQLVNCIAIEELEAWYFGDWTAVQEKYPRLPIGVPKSRGFRDPDAIVGGTWEAFERLLKRHGYFKAGLPKIEVARSIGQNIDPCRSKSTSFLFFYTALSEAFGLKIKNINLE